MRTIRYIVVVVLSLFAFAAHAVENPPVSPPLSAKEIYAKVGKSIFSIYVEDKDTQEPEINGSAVAISDDLLATNCHVIEDVDDFYIDMHGKKMKGEVYSADNERDVCLIYSTDAVYQPVKIRLSRQVDIGEDVYAIGNPEALEKSISRGIISNKHEGSVVLLQTDAAIAPGSSGGGLFDNHGELIGLTTAKQGDGIGFVVPTEIIMALILNPKAPLQKQTASSNTEENIIQEIGVYGENKVGLYMEDGTCFISLSGMNDNNKTMGVALWLPRDPDSILFFPTAVDVAEAMTIVINTDYDNADVMLSKSKMTLNKKEYDLVSIKDKAAHASLSAVLEKNPTKALLKADAITLDGPRHLQFGMNGFKEAMSAYQSHCK